MRQTRGRGACFAPATSSQRCRRSRARSGRGAGVCRLPIRRHRLLHVWRSGSNRTVAPPRTGSVGRDVSPPLVSAVGRIDTVPSPVSVRKPPRFRGKSWKASPIANSSETRILQDFLGTLGIPRSACHAKGRGFESLQPLSRRPAFAGLLRWGSRHVRLCRVGLKPDSRPADRHWCEGKRPLCRPIAVRPNRSPSAGPQKVECSGRCGRRPALPANGPFLRTDACRALPAIPILGGESDFSPDTVRSTLAPHSDPGEPRLPRRELSAGRPRQRRGARHGRLGLWQSLGGPSSRLSLTSEAGVCSQPGLGSCSSSAAGVPRTGTRALASAAKPSAAFPALSRTPR
jgi:hypothetical protein